MQERVDKGATAACIFILTGACMHHHARRLVDDGKVCVLVNYVEGNVFRRRLERRWMRLASDDDLLAAAQFERSLGLCAIHKHVALFAEQLHPRTAHPLELRGEKGVEAPDRK